jgi:hypothetical protein
MKNILEFPNYTIDLDGNIRNSKTNRILTHQVDHDGYHRVTLQKNGKGYNRFVHRLLAETYLEKNTPGDIIDHINGIRDDNRLENLRWATKKQNRANAHVTCPCCGTRIKV